jgi:hypothetical protein
MLVRLDHISSKTWGHAMGETFSDTKTHEGEQPVELVKNAAKGFSESADVMCDVCQVPYRIGYRSNAQVFARYGVAAALWALFFYLLYIWSQAKAAAEAANTDGSGYTVYIIMALCTVVFASGFLCPIRRIKPLDGNPSAPGQHKMVFVD